MSALTDADWLAIEQMAFQRLADEARAMTALGLEGEDTRDFRTSQFVNILKRTAATPAEAKKFSDYHWPTFKRSGQLRTD